MFAFENPVETRSDEKNKFDARNCDGVRHLPARYVGGDENMDSGCVRDLFVV